jgi:threonine dehydrogenase-like Zn-dependent dehydrogenase
VAVFGLGAIGLMAVQLARIAGASFVAAVDPIAGRRAVASLPITPSVRENNAASGRESDDAGEEGRSLSRLLAPSSTPSLLGGADLVLDPTQVDAGLEIRRATGGVGVDVSIETSGSAHALHQAIRAVAFGGTVSITAWYTEFHGGLDLGREAHLNRPTFVFTRAESEPHRDHPRWNNRRLADAAWELLAVGRLHCESVVQPVVSFDEVVEAYRAIDEHPERSVKLGVVFG